MSGYSSVEECRRVIRETLRAAGEDPRDFNVTGLFRDAFYSRGSVYGYGARDASTWEAALKRHRRKPKGEGS